MGSTDEVPDPRGQALVEVGEGLHFVYRDSGGHLCWVHLDWDMDPAVDRLASLRMSRLQRMLLKARLEYALELVQRT